MIGKPQHTTHRRKVSLLLIHRGWRSPVLHSPAIVQAHGLGLSLPCWPFNLSYVYPTIQPTAYSSFATHTQTWHSPRIHDLQLATACGKPSPVKAFMPLSTCQLMQGTAGKGKTISEAIPPVLAPNTDIKAAKGAATDPFLMPNMDT